MSCEGKVGKADFQAAGKQLCPFLSWLIVFTWRSVSQSGAVHLIIITIIMIIDE